MCFVCVSIVSGGNHGDMKVEVLLLMLLAEDQIGIT